MKIRHLGLALAAGSVLWIAILLLFCSIARAQDWTDSQIADAIYLAEGGEKAKKPFGILSVPCNGYDECRKICLNTIRNNRARFLKQDVYSDYLEFLASRYAPVGAGNDPKNLNINWLKNVRSILERG